jgi:MoxR-like ATPase
MTREQEMQVIGRPSTIDIVESLEQTVTDEETAYVRSAYTQVSVSQDVLGYIMDIIQATRSNTRFRSGVSTRGAMALYKAAQVTAALSGRDYVIPEDVKFVAPHVLSHRVAAESPKAIWQLLEQLPVPLETV